MNPIYFHSLNNVLYPSNSGISFEKYLINSNQNVNIHSNSHTIVMDTLILPLKYINSEFKLIIKTKKENIIIWELESYMLLNIFTNYVNKKKIFIELSKNNVLGKSEIEFTMNGFYGPLYSAINVELISDFDFQYELLVKKKYYNMGSFISIRQFIYNINQYKKIEKNDLNTISSIDGAMSGFYIKTNTKINILTLFLNYIAVYGYDANILPQCKFVKQKAYKNLHKYIIFNILKNLPKNIIKKIIKMINIKEYLYWFPLDYENGNDTIVDLKKCKNVQLIINNNNVEYILMLKINRTLHLQEYTYCMY